MEESRQANVAPQPKAVESTDSLPWPIRLFQRSPLKQEKYRQILKCIGEPQQRTCLDIGSDNGVISYLLRKRGESHGETWYSCDLIPETVLSIRELVGERVEQINTCSTPYESEFFDVVVVVDLLEHIETDREFLDDLYRILKPGGTLVLNVPNPKEGLLRRIRFMIGQTDEAHGHVRPGYSPECLDRLLGQNFEVLSKNSYSRFFSVLIDTFITFGLDLLKKDTRSKKGNVVTGSDLGKMKKSFALYSAIYPFVRFFVSLDRLIPRGHGNMIIAVASKTGTAAPIQTKESDVLDEPLE